MPVGSGLTLRLNRVPINYDCNKDHFNVLRTIQNIYTKNNDTVVEPYLQDWLMKSSWNTWTSNGILTTMN